MFYSFSIKYGDDAIEKRTQDLQLKGMLPCAINKIMRYFCIGTDKNNYGQIFYVEETAKNGYEIELHCEDFQAFLSSLYNDKFYGKVFQPKLGWIDDFDAYTKNR